MKETIQDNTILTCPKCGLDNADGAKFCEYCGSEFVKASILKRHQQKEQIIARDDDSASLREMVDRLERQNRDLQQNAQQSQEKILNLQKKIDSLSHQEITTSNSKPLRGNGSVLLNMFAFIVISVLVLGCVSQCENKSAAIMERNTLSTELSSVRRRNSQLEKIFSDIGHIQPILVSKIEIRNKGENYGETIYSKNTTFINIRVTTLSFVDKYVDVNVKMIDPNGIVVRGENFSKDYSYTKTIYAKKGETQSTEFNGLGDKTKGHWPAGKYKFELYVDGRMIGEKELIIK